MFYSLNNQQKRNIMAIRSQAIDTSMEGSETTGEVESS